MFLEDRILADHAHWPSRNVVSGAAITIYAVNEETLFIAKNPIRCSVMGNQEFPAKQSPPVEHAMNSIEGSRRTQF
jgi:hypothetical protein